MSLRIVAVAAPDYVAGRLGGQTLTSADPASLFNACRYAAWLAEQGQDVWAESNWAVSRERRRQTVLLMRSLQEELADFEAVLEREQPNRLLVGAMTLSLPGAIACARRARDILGQRVLIVLGGRHASETMFRRCGRTVHHPGSPLRLMAEGTIDPVFDFVVAGEGEHLIARLGELAAFLDAKGLPVSQARRHVTGIERAPGIWTLGWLDGGHMETLSGQGGPIQRDELPTPCEMFGIRTSFAIFGGRLTAHAFSDTGRGCAYDCAFCSERRSVTGPLAQIDTAPERLVGQLRSAVRVAKEQNHRLGASAFVEDSVFLGGSNLAIQRFVHLMEQEGLDIPFGAQLTVDQILGKPHLLPELRAVGLRYLFVGIETADPEMIGGMSKDIRRQASWLDRTEEVLATLQEAGIRCGCALLFGLGEGRPSRTRLFGRLGQWRRSFAAPHPISLNWAVQHPLLGHDGGTQYTYHHWGTPPGPFLEAFQDFGEASILYPLAGQPPPALDEVEELRQLAKQVIRADVPSEPSARATPVISSESAAASPTQRFYAKGPGDRLIDPACYPASIVKFLDAEEKLLAAAKEHFDILVEVGCMQGRFLSWAVRAGKAYVGLDVVPRYLDEGRQAAAHQGLSPEQYRFQLLPAEELDVAAPPRSLLFFPFNSLGNMGDVAAVFQALKRSGCPFFISSYATSPQASRCREEYYGRCGYQDVHCLRDHRGVWFISREGLHSVAYHPDFLLGHFRQNGCEATAIPFAGMGMAYVARNLSQGVARAGDQGMPGMPCPSFAGKLEVRGTLRRLPAEGACLA